MVVVSSDGSSVVVSDDLTLPRVWTDGAHPADVSSIVGFLRMSLGQPATVLRCLRTEPRQDGDAAYRWWHCELSDPAASLPRGWRWRRIEKLALPAAEARATIHDGREWLRPGWAAEAYAWIKTQLPSVDEIEQIRCWEFSHVTRVRAASKTYFFKALPNSYAYEPPLTQALAQSHPRLVPKVYAVNLHRRWMLTHAVPGQWLEQHISLEPWLRTVAAYADLQRAWSRRTEELRALGCRQTTLAQLYDQALALGEPPWLAEAIHRLQTYDIPTTLDHGDFWPSNVFVTRANTRVIDWTDAAINHPFFSLVPMRLAFGFNPRRSDPQTLKQAYLERWGNPTRLSTAFDLAQPLAALYYAAKLQALQPHEQWWLPRFVPWLVEIANTEAARLVW